MFALLARLPSLETTSSVMYFIFVFIFNINIDRFVSILQKMKENSRGKKLKIVVLGNKAVGKSSIIRRYTLDDFSEDIQVLIS